MGRLVWGNRWHKTSTPGICGCLLTVLFHVIGLPGLLDDLSEWKRWLTMIPNDLVIDLITWAPMVLGISLVLYLRRQERRAANTPFDMPIRDAIEHLLASGSIYAPYATHGRRRQAEMQAFQAIFRAACGGKVRIAGCEHPDLPPKPIILNECRELKPYDGTVQRSPLAPEGSTFVLGPVNPDTTREHKSSEGGVYWSLLVKSRDLFRLWPKVKIFAGWKREIHT